MILNKKYIYIFLGLFGVFVLYRLSQYNIYVQSHPNKLLMPINREKMFRRVILKVQSGSHDIKDDETYSKSGMAGAGVQLGEMDTLYLKSENVDAVEYEVLADSSVFFTDVEIITDPESNSYDYRHGKPWHHKNSDSYALGNGRAIWAFLPYLYGRVVKVKLSFETAGQSHEKFFVLMVVDKEEYADYLNQHLSANQLAIKERMRKKYQKILDASWSTQPFGRRKIMTTSVNLDDFRRRHPTYKQGVFLNQYITEDSGFRVIITLGIRESVEIEKI